MSIMDRLNLLIRSNLNDTLGKHGSGSGRRALSEMESSLRDARRRRAELRRGEKQLIDQIRKAREKSDQWEERAMMALRNGDEDLAREALTVKNRALRDARQLRDQLDDHRAHIQDIERALEALEHKLEGARNRMRALSDRERRPSTASNKRLSGQRRASKWDEEFRRRNKPQDGDSAVDPERSETFDTSREFREMDRMASKIDGMEAEIEAMRELGDIGGESRRAELERIFRSMEQRGRPTDKRGDTKRSDESPSGEPPVDDDLADLKKKFE